MKKTFLSLSLFACMGAWSCAPTAEQQQQQEAMHRTEEQKVVVYQIFTRLFGNTNTTNTPWGTPEENGVGTFNDITDKALQEIQALGVTHIWYTGVPHHAVIRDYTAYGISNDDPDVVKGRAGSPYAVKDYYNVNPDLAQDPANRLQEFKALIDRTHQRGMKVLIDIVPNHVARRYEGKNNPEGVSDFGAQDDTSVTYRRDNNFYYNPGERFHVPAPLDGYQPLGGDAHPLADGQFEEVPAKWTGNGSRQSQPHFYDWYETVKINYGIRPDGSKDFDELPHGFDNKGYSEHFAFWQDKSVPDSWIKFRDITHYWLDMGVDGLRFDMAEMVPVEFWSYLNSSIKTKNPDAFLLAEVYNPSLYRQYLHLGKMDYLYDKVELYDTLKHIMQGHGSTDHLVHIQEGLGDIEHHMLHFLENHDEQRIASPDFAGSAQKGKPAMVLSATISSSPTLIYFGQEVGEPGAERAGFGSPTRTSIFDYIGVPHHQRWLNNKQYDGGQLSDEEKELRDFYRRLLNFTLNSPALMGRYQELHRHNRAHTANYNHRVFSFARWSENEKLLILTNFDADATYSFDLSLPTDLLAAWNLAEGQYQFTDQLYGQQTTTLSVANGQGTASVRLPPLGSLILKLQ
jgi:glycosidase